MECRKIIHVDMDAFFAAVEQRNDPSLKGKPVIVGGAPGKRGVVAACSYEARRYGIHSAMSSSVAARLCPHAIFLPGNFDEYVRVSRQIRDIFHRYTDLVEPMSLDEAYLDVTMNMRGEASATNIARRVRADILEATRLTASAGVSYNKFLAKAASDYRKPDGITVVSPDKAIWFIDLLPIGKFHGIGRATEKKMLSMGIRCGADLRRMPRVDLVRIFGKAGEYYHMISMGIDNRPVETHHDRKSVGREVTLPYDLHAIEEIESVIDGIAGGVMEATRAGRHLGRTVTLKVRYSDFTTITRSITLDGPCHDQHELFMHARNLLRRTEAGFRKVRLVGISISNIENSIERQLQLPFHNVNACVTS